jgi:adenine C2-methylase RlmN of 23S rRNA A2503 and tRNA A37
MNGMKLIRSKTFANGTVYALEMDDGYPIEVTDTFLPHYTKDAIGRKQNVLSSSSLGDRTERWMIGVSTMSGSPVGCKFCATGKLPLCRNLTAREIYDQVMFILDRNPGYHPNEAKEFKINYTRMGEPFLNISNVYTAIDMINRNIYARSHHYLSTIGVKGSDFSWIRDNITLQFSVHSFDEAYRDWLIPYKHKMTLEEMGQVATGSNLKTTVNLTMARKEDFDMARLQQIFPKERFFIKLSPINPNCISDENEMGLGIIEQQNLI